MNLLRRLATWVLTKQSQKVTHKDLEFAFHDLKGRAYYRIPAVMAMPLERFGKVQEFIMWMSAGMTASEFTALLDVLKSNLHELVKEMVSKEAKANALVKMGAVVNEMELRKDMVIHTDLLYQFVAVHYIREDEPIDTYSEAIQLEKVQALMDMTSQGGAYGFFSTLPELANINKSLNLSPEEWDEYWHASMREQARLRKMIEYLKSSKKLEKDKKTLTVSS